MSEEANATPKRKGKGKLIVMMGLVLMLVGGGFFAVTLRSGKSKGRLPKIELADKDIDLEEFLTNTKNPAGYVRAKLSLRLRKDFSEENLKANMGDVRDAVILTFNSIEQNDITDASKRDDLKRQLAAAMNGALAPFDKDEAKKFAKMPPQPDWDSMTGPVIQVRFSSLATQ